VELLVSPTEDSTKVLAAFARLNIGGCSNFVTSIQIAQLALKHRKNKAGGQRIIAFVGSPISEEPELLQKVGKLLKKNNVAVDVISIGEVDQNNEKLARFVESVVSHDSENMPNSNLIVVPPGVLPQDALLSSPVMHQQGAFGGGMLGGGGGGGGGADGGLGFDESLDPELAMALRVSAEEARAQAQASMEVEGGSGSGSGASGGAGVEGAAAASSAEAFDEDDEEALMQRALAMSLADSRPPAAAAAPVALAAQPPAPPASASAAAMDSVGDDDDDEALRMALALSMASSAAPPQPPAEKATAATTTSSTPADFLDPAALSAMLAEVTGRDASDDPLIQAALEQIRQDAAKASGAGSKDAADSKKRKDGDDKADK